MLFTVVKKYKGKNGRMFNVKISYIPIQLPAFEDKELLLIVVYGFGNVPMMLITNMKSDDKRIAVAITKVYLLRWRIEEYFKFKKQQFNFEDIRVQKMDSIRNLNLLLTIVIGFIGILSEHQNESILIKEIFQCAKSIYSKAKFVYYQIADGIYDILHKSTTGINHLISKCKTKESQQLTLFEVFKIQDLSCFVV